MENNINEHDMTKKMMDIIRGGYKSRLITEADEQNQTAEPEMKPDAGDQKDTLSPKKGDAVFNDEYKKLSEIVDPSVEITNFKIYPIDKKASLRCFLEDNIKYYGNKAISDCYAVSVNDLHSDLAIKFQNPISNKINIQFENKTSGAFIIYDSFGSCVLKENFNGQILINEINWPAGLYYIIINFENQNKSTTLKLVKQ